MYGLPVEERCSDWDALPLLLGGTLVFMFGTIAAVGIQIVSQSMKTQRDILTVAASVGLSAVDFAPVTVFEMFPAGVRILATDGIVLGTVTAVMLNLMLAGRTRGQG
jgi:xanthine/uracil permease